MSHILIWGSKPTKAPLWRRDCTSVIFIPRIVVFKVSTPPKCYERPPQTAMVFIEQHKWIIVAGAAGLSVAIFSIIFACCMIRIKTKSLKIQVQTLTTKG